MFDFVHWNPSSATLGLFEYEGHGCDTRHRNYPKLPKLHTELFRRSLLYNYRGSCKWVNLYAKIKTVTVHLKKHKDKFHRIKAWTISGSMQSENCNISQSECPTTNHLFPHIAYTYYVIILSFCFFVVFVCQQGYCMKIIYIYIWMYVKK